MPDHPRATLGRYRLEELLGEGAFGQVWRAFDPELQRAVAIKMPRPERLKSPRQRDAFLAEARRAAPLNHPGIVQVFDVGQEGDVCFTVSQLVTGGDLAQRIAQGRPTPLESARLVAEVADALHLAHQKGVFHRDIKPGNILLDPQGKPLVSDFGQAIHEKEQVHEQAGIVGSLPYMAPEQAQGDSHWVDGRADIYSLGVVFYELLTGRRPFGGKDWPDLREQILSREPRPPRSLDDSIPHELERITLKCLAKSPMARYSTAGDLAEELRQWLTQESNVSRDVASSWLDSLSPLNFEAERARLRKDFVGRAWINAELEDWLAHDPRRVFLLVGDPGAGKSAYLAQVVDQHPQTAIHHFCVASLGESLDPVRLVQSLAAQLAQLCPVYRQALSKVKREPARETDADVLLRRLIADPLRERSVEQPLLLIVDGLDEAMARQGGSITRLLSDRLDDFPPSVRLILSSRKEPEILDRFGQARLCEISADRRENLQDMADYLEARLREPALVQLLQRHQVEPKLLAQVIARKALGNFLYATQTLQALLSGRIDLAQLDAFPEGLVGVYQRFFERLFPQKEEFEPYRPLLEVILAARQPLTADQLAYILQRDRFEVEAALEKVAAFFPERNGRFHIYHKSIGDWLSGKVGHSKMYRVNVQAGHRLLAARLRENYRAGRFDALVLAYLPAHLLAAELWDDLQTVLTDLRFIEARCRAGLTFVLVNDYQTALAAWPVQESHDPLGSLPKPPSEWLRACTAATAAGLSDPHPGQGAGPVLAQLRSGSSQEMPRTSTPGPAAILARMQQAEAISKTGTDPYLKDTPQGRIRAFANLVTAHSHFLRQHPRETIPLARNEASTGWVAEQGELLAEQLRRPWIGRDPRPSAPRSRPACLRTLRGHSDVVLEVALRSDGRMALSASQDQTLRVWDVASGECIRTLKGHATAVASLAMTPEGRLAVSGEDNGTLQLWELPSGTCLQKLRVRGASFRNAALTPDGRLALLTSRDGRLLLWDIEAGAKLIALPETAAPCLCANLTPDGKLAVAGTWDGSVLVWDLARRQLVRRLDGHTQPVTAAILAADGQTVLSTSYDQTVGHWDVVSGKCLKTWPAHANWVQGAALTPDGQIAVSAGWDGSLRVWDVLAGDSVRSLSTSPICSVALTPDGTLAATANYDQTVRIWDLASGLSLPTTSTHDDIVFNFAWSADGSRAVSASRDQTLRIWDLTSNQCLHILRGHTSMVHGLAMTADGKTVVSTSWDGTARVWDADAGTCRQVLLGHQGEVRDVALTANGQWAFTAGYDQTVRLWRLATGQCVRTLTHEDGALCVACTPDGKKAVSGGWGGSLYVWEVEPGQWRKIILGHRGWITSVAMTPDGRLAISASQDKTLRVWELESGHLLHILQGHTDEVLDVTITPDGKVALSASDDNTVRAWEISTGQCLAVYHAGAEVRAVSELRPDGRFACGTMNGQIHRLALRNWGGKLHDEYSSRRDF